MIYKHILLITFLNEPKFILLQLNVSKYCYASLTIQLKYQSFVYILLNDSSISNNSIQHKLFVCTQFRCQTVLFDP